jgi:tripartite-type tricarboxylate transporter receptor subunit TctC
MPWTNKLTSLLCVFTMVLAVARPGQAQTYPSKPVRIVVAAGPGSVDDVVTRLMLPKLSETLGQQFIADNRPGAAGMIGQTHVADSPPDGYTLLYAGGSMAGAKYVNANIRYDVLRDFTPISLLSLGKFVLIVHPSVPARNLKEYIALARSQPRRMSYATTGFGQTPYWNAVLFNHMAGIKAVEVPYKNAADGVIDVIAGRVDYYFVSQPLAVTNKAKVRALAVTATTRSIAFPDVPTISEAAVPGYDMPSWSSLAGPGKMQREIVNSLNAAVVRALKMSDIREKLQAFGLEPSPCTPEEAAKWLADWVERYGKIAKMIGIKPQ